MNIKNLIISIVFIVLGAALIGYALSRPCNIAPITQTVQGETITVEQPVEFDRLMCMSADYLALIPLLIGTAMIFPGVGGLYRSLTTENLTAGKKSKK